MKTKTCPDCNGDGVVDKDTDDERQCPTCRGLGFVHDDDDYEEVIKTSGDLPIARPTQFYQFRQNGGRLPGEARWGPLWVAWGVAHGLLSFPGTRSGASAPASMKWRTGWSAWCY
jgi:hypothetical protein